jgi:DNA-binding response OmpR family regulator
MNESKKDYSILIVEDDPIIARVLETILKDADFLVDEPVNSGEKAINRVVSQRPGIVLMDIDLLGKLSGIETARILLHFFSVPVIFVTGHDEEEVLMRSKDADPYGFLIKPINQNILNTTIQIAVNLHEKICSTTEGKTGGLTPFQRTELLSSLKSVVLLDDKNRIIWMNSAAEFLIEQQAGDLLLTNGAESIIMIDPINGNKVDIFSLDPMDERPLTIQGTGHDKQVIPRIFIINNPFGDIGGYYLEFNPAGA